MELLIGKLKRKEFTILELAFARGKESQAIYIPSTLVAGLLLKKPPHHSAALCLTANLHKIKSLL